MKNKVVLIVFSIFILLFVGGGYFYDSFLEINNSGYVGNISNPDIASQLIYNKTHNRQSIFEEQYKYVFVNGLDTTFCGIILDSVQIESLILLDSCYKDGALYELQTPLKGFSAYLSYDNQLEGLYSLVSDLIYIPNSLYTLTLSPIKLNSNNFNTYIQSKGRPRRFMYLLDMYYKKYAYPYLDMSSIIQTRQVLESWGTNCLLYSNDHYPGIDLLYKSDGFSPEIGHITQYPIILLSHNNEVKSLLYQDGSQKIHIVERDYTFTKPYCLTRYNSGYLICVKGNRQSWIPAEETLDTLITLSNILIKTYLKIPSFKPKLNESITIIENDFIQKNL